MTPLIRSTRSRVIAASAIALVAAAWAGAPSADARAMSAQKGALTQTNRDCAANLIPPEYGEAFGFAVVRKTAAHNLVASISVQGARPNTTYNIRLVQLLPDNSDCSRVDGAVTTDADGNANTNVKEQRLPDAAGAWVVLNAADDFTDFYDGAPVHF